MLHHLSVSEGPGWRIHIIDICQKVCTSTREASWALLKLFLLNPRSLPSPHLSQWEAILFITSDHPSFGPFLSYTHRPKHFAQTLSGNHSNQSLRISPTLLSSTHQSSDDRTIRHFDVAVRLADSVNDFRQAHETDTVIKPLCVAEARFGAHCFGPGSPYTSN